MNAIASGTVLASMHPRTIREPILLYNGECAVCRAIGGWVKRSSASEPAATRLRVQPIGDDPEALRQLNPNLNIWDAYDTIHMLMPDGGMKTGGEAVAEVLRRLPNTRWFAGLFAVRILGIRPFQIVLNGGYLVLADVRPLLGCESCGTPPFWVRPIAKAIAWAKASAANRPQPRSAPHFTKTSRAT